jgi:hypothetical protein
MEEISISFEWFDTGYPKMKKLRSITMPLLVIFLFFAASVLYGDVMELKRTFFYPKESQDYYFKPISDLLCVDDMIYGVENLRNKVIALKFEPTKISYTFDIGRPGEGPGDLQHPFSLSIRNDEIAVKEAGFFSFFNKAGKYLFKFRAFSYNNDFVYINNKIYWRNANLKEDHLIEIYTKEGERISSFGKKFLAADINAFQNPPFIESLLYEGYIFSDGKSIFYFNSRFGNYIIFSLEGKTLAEGDISEYFGERGKKIKEYNNETYIERKKDKKRKSLGYPRSEIFEDGYLYNNKIYFISSTIMSKNGMKTIFELRKFDIKSINPLEEYIIQKDGICRLDSLAILEKDGQEYVLLAITVIEEGFFLEVYKD